MGFCLPRDIAIKLIVVVWKSRHVLSERRPWRCDPMRKLASTMQCGFDCWGPLLTLLCGRRSEYGRGSLLADRIGKRDEVANLRASKVILQANIIVSIMKEAHFTSRLIFKNAIIETSDSYRCLQSHVAQRPFSGSNEVGCHLRASRTQRICCSAERKPQRYVPL